MFTFTSLRKRRLFWMSAVFSIVLSYALAAQTTQAADEALRESLDFEGGYPENVIIGSSVSGANDMLYAGLNSPNGIFVSNDFGENWNGPAAGSDFGTISEVAASTTPGTAFMIGGINLYRTQDNGATWEELSSIQNVAQFFTTGPNGLLVVPTRDNKVAVSADDGATFSVFTLSSVAHVAVTAGGTIVALANGNGEEGEPTTLYTLEVGDADFTNTGQTDDWRYIATDATDENLWVLSGRTKVSYTTMGLAGIMDYPTNPENLDHAGPPVIRPSGRVYVAGSYTDDALTWTNVSNISANWVTFDDVNNYVYTQTSRGVGRSDDDGATFANKITGMTGVTVNDVAQDSSKEIVWLAAQGGFAKSENFASSIAASTSPTWEFPVNPNDSNESGSAVYVMPDSPNNVLAGTGTIFYSTDGGDTWAEATTPLDPANRSRIRKFAGDATGVLYATYSFTEGVSPVVGGGVLMSDDVGVTWSDMGLVDVPAGPIVAFDTGTLLVGAGVEQDTSGAKRGLYMFDTGIGWQQLSMDSESDPTYGQLVNDLLYVTDSNLLIGISSGADMQGIIFSIVLGEATWSVIGEGSIPSDFWGQSLAYSADNPDVIYASTARPSGTGSIYACVLSTDTCALYYTGLKDETFNAMLFDGLVTGSNVGLFNYKNAANLDIKVNKKKRRITFTLSDAVTIEKLSGKKIGLYRKVGDNAFRVYRKKNTNDDGVVRFTVKPKHGGTFQGRWKMKSADRVSYAVPVRSLNKKLPKGK